MIANPVKFSGTPITYSRPPPLLSEHTVEILRSELGLSLADIEQLRHEKVI